MSKRHIMGSKPAQDPLSEVKTSSFTISGTTAINWQNREIPQSWNIPLLLCLISFVGVFFFPIITILASIIAGVVAVLLSKSPRGIGHIEATMKEVPDADLSFIPGKNSVKCHGVTKMYASILDLDELNPRLPNNLASLIRAVPMGDGFCLTVSMTSVKPGVLRTPDIAEDNLNEYFHMISKKDLERYIDYYNGLWGVSVSHTLLVSDEHDISFHHSSIQGSIPTKWSKTKQRGIVKRLESYSIGSRDPDFLIVGTEASEWLVQLKSELSSEVGISIPGQFVSPIRERTIDYRLGTVINPDTLQLGPPTGITHEELVNGLIIAGGDWELSRRRVLMLLIQQLITNKKRVVLLSSHKEALELTALSSDAVGMSIGKELVLNPVDPENVPRTEYVEHLIRALETFTQNNLSDAPDLENALGRAVAIGNATVADVSFTNDEYLSAEEKPPFNEEYPNKGSLTGMSAIRRMHQGAASRAFYGTQTVKTKTLVGHPLSVLNLSMGSLPFDKFAWDLLCIKLLGEPSDKDVVVILDDPENLNTMMKRYDKREPWMEQLFRMLISKFSVIVSTSRPSTIPKGVLRTLSACLTMRLRSDNEIASIAGILGLGVITSMHTKDRWSPREGSYLRSLEDDVALLVCQPNETPHPVKLDDAPVVLIPSEEDLRERLSSVTSSHHESDGTHSQGLLGTIAKRDPDLTKGVLRLLERYEPLTEESMGRFIKASGKLDGDIEGVLIRLKESGLILEGHETHSGVSYKNYRLTLKGTMAIRQSEEKEMVEGVA